MRIRNFILSHRVLTFVIVAVLSVVMTVGTVFAAITFTFQGSATVVPSGGGGGDVPAISYDYEVYTDASGTTLLANGNTSYFALGSVLQGAQFSKPLYLKKTGTASTVYVVASATAGSDDVTVTVPATPIEVGSTIVEVPITIAISQAATFEAKTFSVSFNFSPTP